MSLTKATYSMVSGAPVNIRDFGADPTGATDSTAAIEAAIAASSGVVNNSFYGGASSINAVNLSAIRDLTMRDNKLTGTGAGHLWNASNRIYGNVIAQDNSWQYAVAAPSSNIHIKGEIWNNTTLSAGGYAKWLCITSGTPGTFKQYSPIAA